MQTKKIQASNRRKAREFVVVIERDEEGWYIASVPELHGYHTQARSLDELTKRIKEAIRTRFAATNFAGCRNHLRGI